MSRIPLDPSALEGNRELLPIEFEDNSSGRLEMKPCEYLANITSNKIKHSANSGNDYMELIFSINHQGKKFNIPDIYVFSEKAGWKIGGLAKLLKLNLATLDTDDFLDQYVWVTVKHEEYEGKTPNADGTTPKFINNKINFCIRAATAEEIQTAINSVPVEEKAPDSPF